MKFYPFRNMPEGRKSQVVLLDDHRLDMFIKPKLYAGELLDMVASHFNLKEKEYFGLAFNDSTGHLVWLQLDKRVLEHELPKVTSQALLILFFRIKYFVESITYLREKATVEAFYLQAQSLVYQGMIGMNSDKIFFLAALVIQAAYGDYTDDETARKHIKELPLIPTSTLVEYPSLTVCEEKIIEKYKTVIGQSRGNAIISYMHVIESLPVYGVHFYEVKDKSGIPWWLGMSHKGIYQYDFVDKKQPRKTFPWKHLENLYFRDRKFSIEVHDPKKESAKKGFGIGNIQVFVWFAASPFLTKCIWSMAVAQHQFYLDRKNTKTSQLAPRNLSEIAAELDHNIYSTSTDSVRLSRSTSTHSLPALKIDGDSWDERGNEVATILVELKARKEVLEDELRKKNEELIELCGHEEKLTGVSSPELPLSLRKSMLTKGSDEYSSLKDKLIWKERTEEEKLLSRLNLEYNIQNKIVLAFYKIINNPALKKSQHHKLKLLYQRAQEKLKELEEKLTNCRNQVEVSNNIQQNQYLKVGTSSIYSFPNVAISPINSKDFDFKESDNKKISRNSNQIHRISSMEKFSSAPSSPISPRQRFSSESSPSKLLQSEDKRYTPSNVYKTGTSYRSQQYPTLSPVIVSLPNTELTNVNCSMSGHEKHQSNQYAPVMMSSYQNKYETMLESEELNLYSVQTQRASQALSTQDDISASSLFDNAQDLGLMSRHNSLDRTRRHSVRKSSKLINEKRLTHGTPPANILHSGTSHNEPYHPAGTIPVTECMLEKVSKLSYIPHHPHHFHHRRHKITHTSNADCKARSYANHENYFKNTYSNNQRSENNVQITSNHNCSFENVLPDNKPLYERSETINMKSNLSSENFVYKSEQKLKYNYTGNFCHTAKNLDNYHTSSNLHFQSKESSDFQVQSCNSSINADIKHRKDFHRTFEKKNNNNNFASTSYNEDSFSANEVNKHYVDKQQSPKKNTVKVSVLNYGHIQPYWEETKPYETSDFYKYSTKYRKKYLLEEKNKDTSFDSENSSGFHSQFSTSVLSELFNSTASTPETEQRMYEKIRVKNSCSSEENSSISSSEKITSNIDNSCAEKTKYYNKKERLIKTTLV